MHTSQGDAKPTQLQNKPPSRATIVFEWTDNRVEDGLQLLHREDLGQRQLIVEIIHELSESNLFYKLLAKYEDAHDLAVKSGGNGNDELMAFAARLYIAGSMRGAAVLDA